MLNTFAENQPVLFAVCLTVIGFVLLLFTCGITYTKSASLSVMWQ